MQYQPTQISSPVEKKEKKTGSVAFILSLLFHSGILLMIGGIVLIPAVVQKSAFTADPNMVVPTDIQMDEPPDAAQDQNDLPPSQAPQENMQLSEQPTPAAQNDLFVAREDTSGAASSWAGLAASTPVDIKQPKFEKKDENLVDDSQKKEHKLPVGAKITLFGAQDVGDSSFGLKGTLYDLKQDTSRKATEMAYVEGETNNAQQPQNLAYEAVLLKLAKANFDPNLLSKYYSIKRSLYLPFLMIPASNAGLAPAAFKAEKEVKPLRWLIHYQGKMTAPESGKYRFIGYGDDNLLVGYDGKVVLDGSIRGSSTPGESWPVVIDKSKNSYKVKVGKWFTISKGSVHRLDLVIGEELGGIFEGYLLIEKEGTKYEMDASGIPILPLFRMTSDVPKLNAEQAKKVPFKFIPDGPVFGSEK